MMKMFLCVLVLSVLSISPCTAQDILANIQLFTIEDGLSDRFVYTVNQDERGLIWVGTGNGLNRFDGKSFQTPEEESLSSGYITGIKKDESGKFWIQKKGESVIVFNPEKEIIQPLTQFSDLQSELLEIIYPQGQSAFLYFKNEINRVFYLNEDNRIVPFGKVSLPLDAAVKPSSSGKTLLYTLFEYPYIVELNAKGDTLQKVAFNNYILDFYEPSENFFRNNYFINKAIHLDRYLHEQIFSFENKELIQPIVLRKNGQPLQIKDIPKTNEVVNTLKKDKKGNIWLVTNTKLWLFDQQGNLIKDFSSELEELVGDIPWNCNHLYIDIDNRLWISTGIGLFLVNIKENPFQHYLAENNKYSTRAILELPNDQLLITSYKGSRIIDKWSGDILKNLSVIGIGMAQGKGDSIFIGCHSNLVYLLEKEDLPIKKIATQKTISTQFQVPFYDSITGSLFVGSNEGLYFLNKQNGVIVPYTNLNEFQQLARSDVNSFFRNQEGIWLATNNGIFLLDPKKGIIENIQIPNYNIKHIHQDKQGDFWIATGGGGMIHWNRRENIKTQYTTEDGLSHNVIYAIYEDANQQLWLPSNNGLMRFDKSKKDVVTFHTEDGIAHQEFNSYSHYQSKDGRLYFGGLNGVTAFHPKDIDLKDNEATFIVTDLKQFDFIEGKMVNKTMQYLESNKIILNAGDKFFTLQFSLLDYFARDHTYAWKIEGLDNEWNYQTDQSLRINGLPYGDFVLVIKAKGEGGKWAKNELHIPIQVIPPFYESRLFYVVCSIGLVLLTFVFYKWRVYRLEKNQLRLEREVKERTLTIRKQNEILSKLNAGKDQFLSLIGHDLRGPLLSLRGLSKKINFLIQNNRITEVNELGNVIERATENVTKLLDNLLNWALIQKGQFPYHPETILINEIVEEVLNLYQLVAETKGVHLNPFISEQHTVYCDRNAMSTILRNLVDNAIKYTPINGTIQLSAVQTLDYLSIKVTDNGHGISKGQLPQLFELKSKRTNRNGTGLGLILCKELIEMNKGSIKVNSAIEKGTVFTIQIPLSRSKVNTTKPKIEMVKPI